MSFLYGVSSFMFVLRCAPTGCRVPACAMPIRPTDLGRVLRYSARASKPPQDEATSGRLPYRLSREASPKVDIFRTTEAWCPACLEQWRAEGVPIYSPLLWSVRVVVVCPVHAFSGRPLSALPFAVHSPPGRGTAGLLFNLFAMARGSRLAFTQGFPRRSAP